MKRLLFAAVFAVLPAMTFAEGMIHYLAIHVDQNDPKVMNLALNNALNVSNFYAAQGDEVTIEMVAYGPGLTMYLADASPVADRIASMSLANPNIIFSACGNTLSKMSAAAGHDIAVMEEVGIVPAGVVRLMELQGMGYAYLRP